jgi:hypothetical protein
MARTLQDLQAAKRANMDRLVHLLAQQSGYDLSEGLAPDLRLQLEAEVEHAYEQWGEFAEASHVPAEADTDFHRLLMIRHDIDIAIALLDDAPLRDKPLA